MTLNPKNLKPHMGFAGFLLGVSGFRVLGSGGGGGVIEGG